MSVNMPNLCQQLDSVLATDRLHSALLISTTGAVVVSACLLPQRDRTIISLAALGTETWTEIASSPERDGWATCDVRINSCFFMSLIVTSWGIYLLHLS